MKMLCGSIITLMMIAIGFLIRWCMGVNVEAERVTIDNLIVGCVFMPVSAFILGWAANSITNLKE